METIRKAFQDARRADFLPPEVRGAAGADIPLSIGFGQTNSQPSTVRRMLEWLDVEPGNNILDVGSGSGWTTALLALITGKHGRVFAVERIPELVAFGRNNCGGIGITNADFFEAKEEVGLPDRAPFDRILVSASAESLPLELLEQLESNGKMVIPIKNEVLEISKYRNGDIETIGHLGFMFVPLL